MTAETTRENTSDGFKGGQTFAESVFILLTLTVVQRGVGFVRGILFCRWLDASQLGQWDVAFGFLSLAAPVAVLGLPGSFGRYVEHYRGRGQLRSFLARVTTACFVLMSFVVLGVALKRDSLSRVVFGTPDQADLVLLLAAVLAVLVAHNFLTSLFTALRHVRTVALMQFFNSVGFAVIGACLVAGWSASAHGVALAYLLACLLTLGGGLIYVQRAWARLPAATERLSRRLLWSRLLPFAIWVWVTNWLCNLFDLADRYMLVHASGLSSDAALALVGQYHSSRVVPLLFFGIADALGSMMMPHLAQDWEAGRRDLVVARLNLLLKVMCVSLTAAGALVLVGGPLLFDVILAGKYAGGLAVLPWTLTYCAWGAAALIAMNYLWCAEKARLACIALCLGLFVNVGLNMWLVPRYGLPGAVLATAAAHLTSLITLLALAALHGLRLPASTWIAILFPSVLSAGPWTAIAMLAAISIWSISPDGLLTQDDKQRLGAVWRRILDRAGAGRGIARLLGSRT